MPLALLDRVGITSPEPSSQMPDLDSHHQPGLVSSQTSAASALSPIERLPQEILDEIIADLHSCDAKSACLLLRTSRTMSQRARWRLYEVELEQSNFLLVWAGEKGNLDLVRYLTDLQKNINRSLERPWRLFPSYHSYVTTPLHLACFRSHTELVLHLLDCRANVHVRDSNGFTPLFDACTEEIVEALLKAGADANERQSWTERTLLHHFLRNASSWEPSVEIVRLLLETGKANPNVSEHRGSTALIRSIHYGIEMVETLLRNGADPDFVPPDIDDYWISPLGRAVHCRYGYDIAKLLLLYGASVDIPTIYTSPLLEATIVGDVQIVRLLLAEGADINTTARAWVGSDDDEQNFALMHPLNAALLWENWEMADLLLAAGADINHQYLNPLETMICWLSADGVEYLLDWGAHLNEDSYARSMRTYIRIAVDTNDTGLEEPEELEEPQDPEDLGEPEWPAYSIHKACDSILDLLFEYGCDINEQSHLIDENPSFIAVTWFDDRLIRKVISHGGDCKSQLSTSRYPVYTPLHHALLEDRASASVVRCLLDNGADPWVGYSTCSTPLACFIFDHPWGKPPERWCPCSYLEQWESARCILDHCGPMITANFSIGMMALFLRRAITGILPLPVRHPVWGTLENRWDGILQNIQEHIVQRILLFARLTNVEGRWGPDGLSGLRELTSRPEYWAHPRFDTGWARDLLIQASKILAKLCPREGKAEWVLMDIGYKVKIKPKSEPMSDDALQSAFESLFGTEEEG